MSMSFRLNLRLHLDAPIAVPPYRMSPAGKQYLRNELDKMLADDIIEANRHMLRRLF